MPAIMLPTTTGAAGSGAGAGAGAGAGSGGSGSGVRRSHVRSVGALVVRARRFWKRLGDKDSGYHPLLTRAVRLAFRAAKLGVYTKIIIVCLLFLRIASHSAQMATPASAITAEAHRAAMRAATSRGPPELRIVVLSAHGDPTGLTALLSSLGTAAYGHNVSVALDIWLFTTTKANALPFFLLPLAIALFGPPRFDHSVAAAAASFGWQHGAKSLIATRSEQDWLATWAPSPNTANETLLFVDAARVRSLSPTFYSWLKKARSPRADVLAYALDALYIPPPSRVSSASDANSPSAIKGNSVLLEAFFPGTAAFSPTFDGWSTFLKWHKKHARGLFSAPKLHPAMRVGGYDRWEAQQVHPVRAWFAQFAYEYHARIVHPSLPDNQVLVVRKPGLSDPAYIAGVGVVDAQSLSADGKRVPRSVHISVDSEVRVNEYVDHASSLTIVSPNDQTVIKWDGTYASVYSPFGASREGQGLLEAGTRPCDGCGLDVAGFLDEQGITSHRRVVEQIVSRVQPNGHKAVTLVPVSQSSLESICSWLCNVGTLHILPYSLVLLASNDMIADSLRSFISGAGVPFQSQRNSPVLVLSLQFALLRSTTRVSIGLGADNVRNPDNALKAEGLVTLDRAFIIADVLRQGVGVLVTHADQTWFRDPIPYVEEKLAHPLVNPTNGHGVASELSNAYSPDFIIPVTADGVAAGSLFYIRPTLESLLAWDEVILEMKEYYIDLHVGDQGASGLLDDRACLRRFAEDTLRRYVAAGVKSNRPLRIAFLSRELFVDGTWYLDFEGEDERPVRSRIHYTSAESGHPVVVSNDYIKLPRRRVNVAKRFDHWFLTSTNVCKEDAVPRAAVRN